MLKLSVIIPTRNRSTYLRGTLESITAQTLGQEDFEVIVIDNGSTDDTKEVTNSFKSSIKNLVYHYDERPGLHVGRHAGLKLAQSDILVYADDDIIAFPSWLKSICESFEDSSVVLVGGKDLPKYEANPPFWVKEKWYKLCEFGHCMFELSLIDFGEAIKEISPSYVFGCNFAIRKEILKETKGFHPDGMPFEKIEYRGDGESFVSRYIKQNGLKTIYNPGASVYHIVTKDRMTLDYFKKRAFCEGVEKSYAAKRYGVKRNPVKAMLSKIYRGCRQLFSNNNVHCVDIEEQIELSKRIGFQYHSDLYNESEELRRWVHKDNYLD